MAVTCDPEHKFELALQLGDLKVAYQLAKETEVVRHLWLYYLHKCNQDLSGKLCTRVLMHPEKSFYEYNY